MKKLNLYFILIYLSIPSPQIQATPLCTHTMIQSIKEEFKLKEASSESIQAALNHWRLHLNRLSHHPCHHLIQSIQLKHCTQHAHQACLSIDFDYPHGA